MRSELVKRFVIEIKQDYSLYSLFEKGLWYPNIDEYTAFLHKMNKNNERFARVVKKFHLLKSGDEIFETNISSEYSVLEHLNHKGVVLPTKYGRVQVASGVDFLNYNICYLTNGVCNNTFDLVDKSCKASSFIVGVVDNKDSLFFKENRKKLEELKAFLKLRHVKYSIIEENEHRDNVYILTHRRDY